VSTKSRQKFYSGSVMGVKIRAQEARKATQKAARKADRAEAEAWIAKRLPNILRRPNGTSP
jgi:hypothetical protein